MSLYRQILRYELLNLSARTYNKTDYVYNRKQCFVNSFNYVVLNRHSDVKAQNLASILYARYFVTSHIVRSYYPDPSYKEDDKQIKEEMNKLINNTNINTHEKFNGEYSYIIMNHKPGVFKFLYNSMDVGKPELFSINDCNFDIFEKSSKQIDKYLLDNINEDIDRLK